MKKVIAFYLIMLVAWFCTGASRQAEGKNLEFTNPNPDRTWTKQVGGFLFSAKSYAVVISISEYIGKEKGGYPKLDTRNDAEKFKNFLLEDMGFDYVRVITDTDVTKQSIEIVMLDEMRTLVGPNDRFVFYWSGHGDQVEIQKDGEKSTFGFLPLYDSKVGKLATMISMNDISRWNSLLQARHALFILDACLSGLVGIEKKSNARLVELSLPARFLLSAGAAKQEAIAGDQWGGSLFTDALIKVVREHTQGSDKVVSIYKVFDDVQERVLLERQKADWSKPLTPQMKDLHGGTGAFFFRGRPTLATAAQAPIEATPKAAASEKGAEAGKAPPEHKELVDHCYLVGQGVLNVPRPPRSRTLSSEDALRVHLGASTGLLSKYAKQAGVASASKTFDLSGLLRGSFETVSSTILKCDGMTSLTRETILAQGTVVAVAYSYSYTTERLVPSPSYSREGA